MGRYTGAVCRLCRREGTKLFLKGERCVTGKCAISKKRRAPGSAKGRRGKVSYYGQQLREKQKVKRYYSVSELQFRESYEKASRALGNTGELLLQYLERRLDNIVYRLGFADSRAQARQMILHGFFTLNDRKANIPSMLVKKGDLVKVKESRKSASVIDANIQKERILQTWLEKTDDYTGKIMELPLREDIQDIPIQEQLIIELYSK